MWSAGVVFCIKMSNDPQMNPRGWVHFWDITGCFWCLGLYLINALNIKVIARLIHPTVRGVCWSTSPNMLCRINEPFFWSRLENLVAHLSINRRKAKVLQAGRQPRRRKPKSMFPSQRSPLSAGTHCAVTSWFWEAGCLKFEREPKGSRGGRI